MLLCEYITFKLHGKKDFADIIEVINWLILKLGEVTGIGTKL